MDDLMSIRPRRFSRLIIKTYHPKSPLFFLSSLLYFSLEEEIVNSTICLTVSSDSIIPRMVLGKSSLPFHTSEF